MITFDVSEEILLFFSFYNLCPLIAYVAKQKERIQKLQNEFNYAKERQRELQSDVFLMENDLLSRRKHSLSQEKLSAQDISQLHADTRRLQAEIHTIMQELGADRAQKGFDSVE